MKKLLLVLILGCGSNKDGFNVSEKDASSLEVKSFDASTSAEVKSLDTSADVLDPHSDPNFPGGFAYGVLFCNFLTSEGCDDSYNCGFCPDFFCVRSGTRKIGDRFTCPLQADSRTSDNFCQKGLILGEGEKGHCSCYPPCFANSDCASGQQCSRICFATANDKEGICL